MKANTYLPVFTGFYGSSLEAWSSDCEMEIENIVDNNSELEGKEPEIADILHNCYDFEKDRVETSKSITHIIEQWFKDQEMPIESIEFQRLVSPREYNFVNDSIDVEITFKPEFMSWFSEWFTRDGLSSFRTYIEARFKSRDGFISFYSDNPEVWVKQLFNGGVGEIDGGHFWGSMLQFFWFQEQCGLDEFELLYYGLADCRGSGDGSFDDFVDWDKFESAIDELKS